MYLIGLIAFLASFLIPLLGMVISSHRFVAQANRGSLRHMHERLQQHAEANRKAEVHAFPAVEAAPERRAA